jgi:tRNA 2-selenouridine synthase SelU
MLTQINGSNAIEVSTKSNKQQTVSLKLDTTTTTGNITSDMLEINSNGLMMKNVWDCGTF